MGKVRKDALAAHEATYGRQMGDPWQSLFWVASSGDVEPLMGRPQSGTRKHLLAADPDLWDDFDLHEEITKLLWIVVFVLGFVLYGLHLSGS